MSRTNEVGSWSAFLFHSSNRETKRHVQRSACTLNADLPSTKFWSILRSILFRAPLSPSSISTATYSAKIKREKSILSTHHHMVTESFMEVLSKSMARLQDKLCSVFKHFHVTKHFTVATLSHDKAYLGEETKLHERIGPFTVVKTLGTGSFSKVKLGRHHRTGNLVALKLFPIPSLCPGSAASEFLKNVFVELWILSHLPRHPNITQLEGVILDDHYFVIVLEYVEGVELFDFINEHGPITEKEALLIFKQLLAAIEVLHSRGIVHRDIKLENLILSTCPNSKTFSSPANDKTIKIVDFGLATWLPFENASEIISYELKAAFDRQLSLFQDLVIEYGRKNSPLKGSFSSFHVLRSSHPASNSASAPGGGNSDYCAFPCREFSLNFQVLQSLVLKPRSLLDVYDNSLSLYQSTKLTARCGSEEYAPPELLRGLPYDGQKGDIWSLGIVLFAMVLGRLPFEPADCREGGLLRAIIKGVIEWPSGEDTIQISPQLVSVIEGMLSVIPSDRFASSQIRSSPWYNSSLNTMVTSCNHPM